MGDKVVNLDASREKAKHRKKEAHLSSLQQRFEKALPIEEIDPKKKLLDIFKKK
jgi:hypothetical protein